MDVVLSNAEMMWRGEVTKCLAKWPKWRWVRKAACSHTTLHHKALGHIKDAGAVIENCDSFRAIYSVQSRGEYKRNRDI